MRERSKGRVSYANDRHHHLEPLPLGATGGVHLSRKLFNRDDWVLHRRGSPAFPRTSDLLGPSSRRSGYAPIANPALRTRDRVRDLSFKRPRGTCLYLWTHKLESPLCYQRILRDDVSFVRYQVSLCMSRIFPQSNKVRRMFSNHFFAGMFGPGLSAQIFSLHTAKEYSLHTEIRAARTTKTTGDPRRSQP